MKSAIRLMAVAIMVLLAGVLISAFAAAQPNLPVLAPIIGMTPAAHDAIILYDVSAETYRRLELGAGWHYFWGFAPDGCRILYTLQEGTLPAKLYSARLDGSDQQALVQFEALPPDNWGVWEPQWSPDNSKIAFTMIRNDNGRQTNHIAWIPPEGGAPTFYSVAGSEFSPQWSPDGAWLAYISYESRAAGADAFSTAVPTPQGQTGAVPATVNEADLWIVSHDGRIKYPATGFLTGSVTQPRWSPDGQLISFVYSPSGNNDTFWMIGAQQGAVPTQLSFQWSRILDNTWLPNSSGIIGAAREFRDVAQNRLWHIPLVGNADENATLYLENLPLNHADYPRFSADGQWLAVRTAYELALVHRPTNQSFLLDKLTIGNTPVFWSPAGFGGESGCD